MLQLAGSLKLSDHKGNIHLESSTWQTVGVEDFSIPRAYVEQLTLLDTETLYARTLCGSYADRSVLVPFLTFELVVRLDTGDVMLLREGRTEPLNDSLLELLTLVYLLNAAAEPLANDMIGPSDLRNAQFFQGPHALKTQPLLTLYGTQADRFRSAAERLGGSPLSIADAAYCLRTFPRIPLYYLLWEGDDEFDPRLSILFDRSIETHLAADAIWGLVNWVSNALAAGG
jgi:hypothetical protein